MTASSINRASESAYAEIPEGQQQNSAPSQPEDSPTNPDGGHVSTNGGASIGMQRGGNEYHEIADVLQQADSARRPTDNNYAYAYVDGKTLSTTRQADVEVNNTQAGPNVDLKGSSPSAKYAEVHKKKKVQQHPKSPKTPRHIAAAAPDHDALPSTIQSYTTVILPEDDEGNEPKPDIAAISGDVEPYDEILIGAGTPSKDSTATNDPQPYGEVEFGTGIPRKDTVVAHDNPEPYSDVEIGKVNNGYSEAYSDIAMGIGLPLEDHYNLEPYGEVGIAADVASSKSEYDHVWDKPECPVASDAPEPYGELGLRSVSKEGMCYDKFPRATCQQRDNANRDESPLNAGYGVILDQADESSGKRPTDNTYSTLSNIKTNTKTIADGQQLSHDVYDRLDRQISTTSATSSSSSHEKNAAKTSEDKHKAKDLEKSPTYSKMKRSNSREGTIKASKQSPVGNEGYGRIGGTNGTDLQPVNDYGTLDKSGAPPPPEDPYATIPDDMLVARLAEESSETYDRFHRIDNHDVTVSSEVQPGQPELDIAISPAVPDAPTVPDTPAVPDTDIPSPLLIQQDILYENTPKGIQNKPEPKQSKKKPLVTTIYDTPLHRLRSLDDYDAPFLRQNSLDTSPVEPTPSVNDNYDSPKSRGLLTRMPSVDQPVVNAAGAASTSYEDMEQAARRESSASTASYYEDMNRRSRTSRGSLDFTIPVLSAAPSFERQDTLYENTARENNEP